MMVAMLVEVSMQHVHACTHVYTLPQDEGKSKDGYMSTVSNNDRNNAVAKRLCYIPL